ncbi:MAG: hypothetical protein J7L39_00910 [Candidatus Aenigmarchaeota archaeon]|nr:hypothetical protein [Candidatus Aenigmarchaeota archaeon]
MLLISVDIVKAISVGVSPSSIDLGELKRGEVKGFYFDLLTSYSGSMSVYVQIERLPRDILLRYKNIFNEISEEDASSWIKIEQNPIPLQRVNESLQSRRVTLKIAVPPDAEPGYHFLKIIPNPIITENVSSQVGGVAVSIASIILKFRVKGSVERNGEILDTVVTYENGNANLETYFLNRGNVTLEVRAVFEVDDKNQSLTAKSPFTLVKPNQVVKLSSSLPLKPEFYNLTTSVYWLGGNTSKLQTIEIEEIETKTVFIPETDYLPLIILIIIIVISYLIWKYA